MYQTDLGECVNLYLMMIRTPVGRTRTLFWEGFTGTTEYQLNYKRNGTSLNSVTN